MSYAIQNFYNINQSVIINQKLVLSWVFRNIHLMTTLIKKNSNTLFNTLLFCTTRDFLVDLFWVFFNPGLHKLFKSLISRWHPLLGTNYTQSLEYWTFQIGISSIEEETLTPSLLVPNTKLFLNQYFTNTVLSNVSLHNKHYLTVLVKFLQLLLVNWQLWKKTYNISFQYVIINKNHHLIRYYNKYFFKVYNF